jgi:hypothetical protein
MKWRLRIALGVPTVALLGWIGYFALGEAGAFNWEFWTRDHPLVNPIRVTSVQEGSLKLEDGRNLRPIGVRRADGVSQADYDMALLAITSQGVVVERDLGDGRAVLIAEPRFYNWCGTRNYKEGRWAHWAGVCIQCPASEALIHTGYATANLDEPGLLPRETWRLEGVCHLNHDDAPIRVAADGSLRYDGYQSELRDLDELIESMWKPPPQP